MRKLKWMLSDIKWNIRCFFGFLKNIWLFRKALWSYDWWDNGGMLYFMRLSLKDMIDNMETKGIEIDKTRLRKVAKMRRANQLIKNYFDSNYIEMAESELGKLPDWELEFEPCPDNPGYYQLIDNKTPEEKEHSKKVFERAREIEEQEWDELFEILKGKKYTDYDKHDGSGIKTWWD